MTNILVALAPTRYLSREPGNEADNLGTGVGHPVSHFSGEAAVSLELAERAPKAAMWKRRHLLGLEELNRSEIETILDTAEEFVEVSDRRRKKRTDLKGQVVCNLFFEASTRTRTSFSLAAKRLSADTIDFTSSGSSISKGESFIDTAKNIEAMGIDAMVVRHSVPGAPHLLAQHVKCSVINAGDGAHEHPTQGLLDIFTVRRAKDRIDGLTVALVGDIAHSRVARSNIHGLLKLGAHVIVCGPSTLIPSSIDRLGVEVAYKLDDILPRCDVINVLRIQFERQRSGLFPSINEYARLFGMNQERLRRAKPGILLLAPGPINRGVELTPDVADGANSAILEQVKNGLAIRMAVLYLLCGQRPGEG
jgi:aspartate carbamoyltransferase catalytic subunit